MATSAEAQPGITAMTSEDRLGVTQPRHFCQSQQEPRAPAKQLWQDQWGGLTRLWGEQGAPGAQKDCRTDTKAWASREEQQGCRGSSPPVEKHSWPGARSIPGPLPSLPPSTPKGFLQPSPKGVRSQRDPSANRALQVQRTRGWQASRCQRREIPAHPSGSRARICPPTGGSAPGSAQLAGAWGQGGIKIHPPRRWQGRLGAGRTDKSRANPPQQILSPGLQCSLTTWPGENLRLPGPAVPLLATQKPW